MRPTISTCLKKGIQFLESAGVPEAQISAEELLSHVLTRPRFSLLLDSGTEVRERQESEFEMLLAKRAARYPLQYLVRTIPFRNAVLGIGEGCLIPRPETEVLVDVILHKLERKADQLSVLDIGTGSGNIAISLAQERPEWAVVATDVSNQALQYAKLNAERNNVSGRIRFVQTDLWKGIENSFDVIVSNPPYLTKDELGRLQPEIEFEPRLALDGGADGLLFFKRIVYDAEIILQEGGFLFFEIGAGQAEQVSAILELNHFGQIQISKDDSGIDRIISACLAGYG